MLRQSPVRCFSGSCLLRHVGSPSIPGDTLHTLPQQGVLVSELQFECAGIGMVILRASVGHHFLPRYSWERCQRCSSTWPKLRFYLTERIDFVSLETVCEHKICNILLFQYSIRKRERKRKNSLVLYSTYLFIPCPQSNPKKCYAKELKENEKKEQELEICGGFCLLFFFKIHIDASLSDNNFTMTEGHSVKSFTICI